MNRLTLLVIMFLSLAIACLLFVFGYIFSPIAQQIALTTDEPLGLERASKIMIWSAAVSLIAGIVAAGGVIQRYYIIWASAISLGLLLLAISASVISVTLYYFTPMCCQ